MRATEYANLLSILDFRELGVDHLLLVGLRTGAALPAALSTASTALTTCTARRRLRVGVHRLAELLRRFRERFRLRLERVLRRIRLLEQRLSVLHRGLDLALLVGADL